MQGTRTIRGELTLNASMDHTSVNDLEEGVTFYSLYLQNKIASFTTQKKVCNFLVL
jgi:hypothetical protein